MRSGMRKRASTAVVTAVSVGEMIAPNVNAAAHGISGNKILAAQPIANAVKNTRPTASSSIGRRLARKARHTVKNALACTSGGRNSASVQVGVEIKRPDPRCERQEHAAEHKRNGGGRVQAARNEREHDGNGQQQQDEFECTNRRHGLTIGRRSRAMRRCVAG